MKKHSIFISLVFLYSCNLSNNSNYSEENFTNNAYMNKISGKYCIEIDNTRTLFLDLNNKGQYNMEIIREADFGSDIENVDIISFGYYKIDSNILLLKDLNLKMEMRFCKEKDSLIICIEGFEYLKNKELKYFGASDIHDWLFDKNNFSLDF